jgi:hypothetical protein
MSMIAKFVALSEADLNAVRAQPSLAEELFLSFRPGGAGGLASALGAQAQLRVIAPQLLAKILPQLDQLDQATKNRLEAQIKALTGMSLAEFMANSGQLPGGPAKQGPGKPGSGIAPRAELSLDKAWHGVHYLLCGKAEEAPGDLAKAVMGGKELGDDPEGFSGYGPARYFNPSEVTAISAALSDPRVEAAAAARFDPDKMEELHIYPGWQDDDEDKDWVMDALRDLCAFYAAASRDQLAIVTCIV